MCDGEGGLYEGMESRTVVIMSSVHSSVPNVIEKKSPQNTNIVDAPMCRGVSAADQDEILFLVSSNEEPIEHCQPALRRVAR